MIRGLGFLFWLIILSSATSFASSYVVVTIDGADPLGVKRSRELGVHALEPANRKIAKMFRLHHQGDKSYFAHVLAPFQCSGGIRGNQQLDLILIAFSWGSNRALQLARTYRQQCGSDVAAVYLIDGVQKPLGPFAKDFPTRYCLNFFQSKGPANGGPLGSCLNFDYTPVCRDLGLGGIPCHLLTGRAAPELIVEDLRDQFGVALRRLIPISYPDPRRV